MWGLYQVDRNERVPPDPTKRDLVWGGPYPCLKLSAVGQTTMQCPGLMRPGKRCFRYQGVGRLWRKFKCDKCGREATDWKVNEDARTSTA